MAGGSGFHRVDEDDVRLLASARKDSLLDCTWCHRKTTPEEAKYRIFNPGKCGHCGGPLSTQEREWDKHRGIVSAW